MAARCMQQTMLSDSPLLQLAALITGSKGAPVPVYMASCLRLGGTSRATRTRTIPPPSRFPHWHKLPGQSQLLQAGPTEPDAVSLFRRLWAQLGVQASSHQGSDSNTTRTRTGDRLPGQSVRHTMRICKQNLVLMRTGSAQSTYLGICLGTSKWCMRT